MDRIVCCLAIIAWSLLSTTAGQMPFDINLIESFSDDDKSYESVEIFDLPDNQKKLGGKLRKECFGEPKDEWKMKWVLPDGREVNDKILKIDGLTLSDAGRYQCVAFNRWSGKIKYRSFLLDFEELYENAKIVPLAGEKFQYGGTILRGCTSTLFYWRTTWILPNGKDLHSRYLTIPQATKKYRGKYTCVTKDPRSGKTVTGWMNVQFYRNHDLAVEISTTPDHKPQIGGFIGLKCHISNRGNWSQRWITTTGLRVHSSELKVRNIRNKDIGRYICVVQNIKTAHRHMYYYLLR